MRSKKRKKRGGNQDTITINKNKETIETLKSWIDEYNIWIITQFVIKDNRGL